MNDWTVDILATMAVFAIGLAAHGVMNLLLEVLAGPVF